jgi:hypothetical protein
MIADTLARVAAWLAATGPSKVAQGMEGYIPTVQSIHILAIATAMVAAAFVTLRVVGVMQRGRSIADIGARCRGPLWVGVFVLFVSGLGLLLAEPERSLLSRVFQLKMLLLVAAVVLTLMLQRRIAREGQGWSEPAPVTVRLLAGASLAVWICIVFAGRWIAYAQY